MSQLPEHQGSGLEHRPVCTGGDSPVDLYKSRGLDLTPAERRQRRSNRRWMAVITIVSIGILTAALIATAVYNSNEPSGPAIKAPPGFHTENDGYFSYVVPSAWANNPSFTDQAGDVDTSGPSGFAAEHIDYRVTAPVLGEAQPASLQSFGQAKPTPYQLAGGHPITVKGAAAALSFTMTRPDGFRAVLVDAWDARAGVELWLEVSAPAAETDTVLASLQA
jgi:hypothetical protein